MPDHDHVSRVWPAPHSDGPVSPAPRGIRALPGEPKPLALFSINPAVQVAEAQEDAIPDLDVGEAAAPDHRADAPIGCGKIFGGSDQGHQPAGESKARAAGPLPRGGRSGTAIPLTWETALVTSPRRPP